MERGLFASKASSTPQVTALTSFGLMEKNCLTAITARLGHQMDAIW
jgi:hypothetical protein